MRFEKLSFCQLTSIPWTWFSMASWGQRSNRIYHRLPKSSWWGSHLCQGLQRLVATLIQEKIPQYSRNHRCLGGASFWREVKLDLGDSWRIRCGQKWWGSLWDEGCCMSLVEIRTLLWFHRIKKITIIMLGITKYFFFIFKFIVVICLYYY